MNRKLFKDLLQDSYPELTSANQAAILEITETLRNIQKTYSEAGSDSAPDWAVLNPHGIPPNGCFRNVMTFASDHSRFSPRWDNSYTLKKALESILTYYEACEQITKLGVLITNVWRPGELSAYKYRLDVFERKGIQSVAILLSGNSVLPIPWPWLY